jgi:hypothetical protein
MRRRTLRRTRFRHGPRASIRRFRSAAINSAIAAHRAFEAIPQCPGNRAGRERRIQRLLLRAAQVLDENAGKHAAIDFERRQLERMQEVIRGPELVRPKLGAFNAGKSIPL